MRTAVGLPPTLAGRDNAVLRPRDAADVYANPRAEFKRLSTTGALLPLADGYYALVPQRRLHGGWRPDPNAVALGIARADYGPDAVALMHLSAARHHAAIPRALGVATVAVPVQRPPLVAAATTVLFVKRDVARLDVEAIETEMTSGWVTTREQTLLDLAARPDLGGLDRAQVAEAITSLGARVDWDLVERLARPQRKVAAMGRARDLCASGTC